MNIEWHRMVKPQSDLYDSVVLNRILAEEYGIVKTAPTSDFRFCDGKVGVVENRLDSGQNGNLINGISYCNPTRISEIDRWLRAWPDGYDMMGEFLHELWPMWSLSQSTVGGHGSSSGHYDAIGTHRRYIASGQRGPEPLKNIAVYVTINNEPGCANGIYHEVGHTRLEVMGIGVEWNNNRLLLNPQTELYDSPIRLDCKRPMSAVVQAIYSWLLLTEGDLAGVSVSASVKCPIMIYNIAKIEDGVAEISKNARWSEEGRQFATAYLGWAEDLIYRTKIALRAYYGESFDIQYASARNYRNIHSSTPDEQQVLVDIALQALAEGKEPAHQRGSLFPLNP